MAERCTDEELQGLLGLALRGADPVPAALHQAALDAYAFCDLDAAVAELITEAATTVRNTGPAPFVFEADALEIALEVHDGRGRGQIAPPGPWPGRLEVPGSPPRPFTADELGRFVIDVPPGPVRVVVDGPDGPVRTEWFRA